MAKKHRLPDSLFKRDTRKEKSFGIDGINLRGYSEYESSIYIIGEVIAANQPKSDFTMMCTIYDSDGDILDTKTCDSYGSGLVTSMIKKQTFFSGFPFSFDIYGVNVKEIHSIKISPEKDY